jgi:hypothetical protein
MKQAIGEMEFGGHSECLGCGESLLYNDISYCPSCNRTLSGLEPSIDKNGNWKYSSGKGNLMDYAEKCGYKPALQRVFDMIKDKGKLLWRL